MKNLYKIYGLALILVMTACGSQSGSTSVNLDKKLQSGKTLAKKGDVEIHEGFVELLSQVNPNIAGQLKNPAGKKRLLDSLLEQELLYREALKRGIPNKEKFQEKAALYQRVIYSQGLLEEEIDVQAKTYYDEKKEEEFSQVGVAHILIRNSGKPGEAGDNQKAMVKAQEAKKKLDEGVAWEQVVEEYSDDRFTKKRGGDLGKLSKNDRRAERLEWNKIIDAAFKMKAGEISEPIQAKDGIHIIKVTEVAQIAPFEEVQGKIKFKIRNQVKKEMVASLGEKEETIYFDEEIKKVTSPQGRTPKTPPPPQPGKKQAEKPAPKPQQESDHGHPH